MNEELDSQLSAMFDNELAPAECELLARRLSRDEQLKARWGRYAAIGATIRVEGGARLSAEVARRVSAAISNEPALAAPTVRQRPSPLASRWWRPVAGGAVAASVAAASILWLRFQALPQTGSLLADTVQPAASLLPDGHAVTSPLNASDSYVVPKTPERRSIVPSTQLANYVVAHSEFSSPVNRRNLLSALMVNESGTGGASSGSEEPTEDVYDDAKSPH
ncbi:MAG: sigma-E factor negative regulatory protein [Steroidobacteraceae bacterium]